MSRSPSWRKVAEVLAERMEHAARAAGAGVEAAGCSHHTNEADPDNCPFCADRAAFRLYVAKLRSTANETLPSGGDLDG